MHLVKTERFFLGLIEHSVEVIGADKLPNSGQISLFYLEFLMGLLHLFKL